MSYTVCIDASLALDWLLPSQQNEAIDRLWQRWKQDTARLVTPPLFLAEVSSIIRKYVYFKRLLPGEGETIFQEFLDMDLDTEFDIKEITHIAWGLARKYQQPRTYDMQYVAVAELADCDLWTADLRLVNSVKGKNKRVRWVGELSQRIPE